jgi:hypothetical protein
LNLLPDDDNLLRIMPDDIFCNTAIVGRCLAEVDGKPLYFDDNHLDSIGASMLSRQIIDAWKQKAWQ